MSGKAISQSETRLEALKIQSSAYGVVIAMMWGVNRLAGNMLWYGGFKAIPRSDSQGGKGGARQVSTTFSYAASVMMALGHGPISDVPRVWRGKKVYSGGITPSQIITVSENYAVPGSGAMAYTTAHAATFTAHVLATQTIAGGDDTYTRTLQLGDDITLQDGIYTVLQDALRGQTVTFQYQYISGSFTQVALQQLGLTFIPGELGQAAWSGLASFGTQNIGYSGLATVAGVDYDLGSAASVENHSFEVVGPMAYHLGSTVPDVDPAVMLRELLSNARAGANFPGEALDGWSQYSDYCVANGLLVSPVLTTQASAADLVAKVAELTNAMPVWSSKRLKMVPRSDVAATANGRTYTPATTPAYALDDDCYTPPEGTPPVRMVRRRPADRRNHVRVEYQDRAQQYNTSIGEARDLSDIEARGLSSKPIIDAKDWIAAAAPARMVAQLIMQRSLHVTADFEFDLPWHYARLEPGDIVTLTDSGLNLSVRGAIITKIEEAEDGRLRLKAEEYPAGSNAAPAYPAVSSSGYQHDYNVAPGNAGTPFVFEVPAELTTTGIGLYVAVPPGGANWGGAQVWASQDGSNYRMLGVLYGAARIGALNGAAGAAASTLAVDGFNSLSQQLISGSAGDATALNTLCYVGGASPEYLAYATATLTGAGAYTLSGLVHGAYGTPANAHADNDTFVRVDDRVLRSDDLDSTMVGKTIYIKVCSFNLYGGAQQGLADVSATTYVVTGLMLAYGLPFGMGGGNIVPNSGMTVDSNADGMSDSWQTYSAGSTGSVTFSRSTTGGPDNGPYQGAFATALGTSDADRIGFSSVGNVPIALPGGGGKVTMSAFVTADNVGVATVDLYIEFKNTAGTLLTNFAKGFVAAAGWSRAVATFTAPAGTVSCFYYLWLRHGNGGAATFLATKVQIEPAAVATGYAPRADELLAGAVRTQHVASEAILKLLSDSEGSGNYNSGSLGDPHQLCTVSFTNADSFSVRFAWDTVVIGLYATGSAPYTSDAFWKYAINGGSPVTGRVAPTGGTGNPDVPTGCSAFGEVTLAAGDAIVFELMALASANDNAFWSGAALRATVHKKS